RPSPAASRRVRVAGLEPDKSGVSMPKRTSRREFFLKAGGAATGLMAAAHPTTAQPQARPPARTSMGNRFRALLQGPEPVVCMGAFDVLSARLVEINGFPS